MTTKETTKAVENMQNNKSPGPDGIPLEFYKHYWHYLKEHLTQVYNENYDRETMSESQRKALLKLLYKKKDKLLLKNWRPNILTEHGLQNRGKSYSHKNETSTPGDCTPRSNLRNYQQNDF